MAYLTLKDINKIYPNGYHAVHNFNLEIDKWEFEYYDFMSDYRSP